MKRKALFQLTARISFLVATLLLASGSFSYFFSLSRMRESTFHNNVEILRQTEFLVATALGVIVRNAYSAAIHQSVVNASNRSWTEPEYTDGMQRVVGLLRERVMSSYYIHSMCLYSRLNDRVITDGGVIPLTGFPDRIAVEEFYRSDKMSAWVMTDGNYASASGEEPVIGFLVRVPIELAEAPGIIVVNVDEGLLYQTVVAVNRRFLGEIFILDHKGVIISHNDKTLRASRFMEMPLPENPDESAGYLIDESAGYRSFVSYYTSAYNGWRYIAIKDYDSVIGDNRTLISIYIVSAMVFILIGVVISLLLSRRYYRPIGEIVNQISGLSADVRRKEGDGNEFQFIRSSIRQISERFEQSRSLLKEHFLIDLLIGRQFDREALQRQMQYYDLDLSPRNYIVAILRIIDKDTDHSEDEYMLLYSIGAKAEEIIDTRCRGIVVNRGWHELVLIMNFADGVEAAGATETANSVAVSLSDNLSTTLDSTVVIGIGGFYTDIAHISRSYREAQEALRYEGIAGSGAIIKIGDIRRSGFPYDDFLHIETEKEHLLKDFRAGQFGNAYTEVDRLVHRIVENPHFSSPYKNTILFGLAASIIAETMKEPANSEEAEMIPVEDLDPVQAFTRLKSTDEMIDWFHELIDKNRQIAEKEHKYGARDITDSVEKYLLEHFRETVDLSNIANMAGFNINYLGRIFKEHTGKTLFEYLTDLRIEAACRDLVETDKPVKTIALETGFINKRNIARAFKRRLGKSPTEYRTQEAIRRLGAST